MPQSRPGPVTGGRAQGRLAGPRRVLIAPHRDLPAPSAETNRACGVPYAADEEAADGGWRLTAPLEPGDDARAEKNIEMLHENRRVVGPCSPISCTPRERPRRFSYAGRPVTPYRTQAPNFLALCFINPNSSSGLRIMTLGLGDLARRARRWRTDSK